MYKYFEINGAKKMSGEIIISGAKNSALPLLIATALSNDVVTLEDIPDIKDIKIIASILERMGSKIQIDDNQRTIVVDNKELVYKELVYEDVSKLRASYYFLGVMVGRYSKAKILLPGGCFLGPRPIDLHIKGLEQMGCEIRQTKNGNFDQLEVEAKEGLKGAKIFLDFPSVGATINLMLAAVHAKGTTILENCAKEPEIIDVANLLKTMGAEIKGVGTGEITIKGKKKLHGGIHQVIPDRIEAGTYLMMGSLLADNLIIKNIIPEHIESLIAKLRESGVKMQIGTDTIFIEKSVDNLKPINIKTGVYPSFPTDLQQIMTTYLTQVEGESSIIDTIYPDRFRNCEHLNNMSSNITYGDGKANIKGKSDLKGTEVIATDLRAGASLVFAGALAKGTTKVFDISHILRGYDKIVEKLNAVGVDIKLVEKE